MPDKKLTDTEIIKALECCSEPVGENCKECPLHLTDCLKVNIEELALDLINRQELKIKGLNRLLYSFLDTRNGDLVHITDNELEIIKKPIKAKAYKEFAERLKENSIATFSFKGVVMVEEIDDLLKELVGEDK